ncbi:YihY/virulence factor BrkB family protein [Cohnella sp. 56]|uniref:YihY/virulence factor BrkB family protein n=1 Tax=Cohnella sp. 56 TaxID=3113722 RepID=UPI0030E9DEE9
MDKKTKKKTLRFAENLYCRFQDDEVPAMGAQLTYYLILAIFPFMIFLVSLIGFTPFTTWDLLDATKKVLPQTNSKVLVDWITNVQNNRSGALLSFGIIGSLWSASSGINAIIKALNKAYDEPETRPFWKVKGLSLIVTIVMTLVLVCSLALLVFGRQLGEWIFKTFSLPDFFDELWAVAQFVIPIVIIALVFTAMYKYVPNRHLKFKEVLPGAIVATVGWIAASGLFAFYVSNFGNYTKTYGSLGGVIVLLTWLYISSIIIVLGGEVNATLAFDREGKTKPECKKYTHSITNAWNKTKNWRSHKKSGKEKKIPPHVPT